MKAVYFALVVLALVACALADGDHEEVAAQEPSADASIPGMCTHPADSGSLCEKKKSNRYAYNIGTHQCVEFTFNGCGGNPNNFLTAFDCRKTCEIQN